MKGDAAAIAAELSALAKRRALEQGWVTYEAASTQRFLFIANGKPYSSGAIDERTLQPAPALLPAFFQSMPGEVEIVTSEIELLLCAVLPFRKAPSAQVSIAAVDPRALETAITETAADCVLSVRRADAFSFCLFRKGRFERLFPAKGEQFPLGESLAHRLIGYAKANPQATIDVYDDLALAPAVGAGEPFEWYAARALGPRPTSMPASLVVKLGGRAVFRFEVPDAGGTIGRAADCDLRLDNVSVSRLHARVRKIANLIAIEDADSENGVVFKGAKTPRAQLAPGEEVTIGKYVLVHAIPGSAAERIGTTQPEISPTQAALETIQTSPQQTPGAVIEHAGERHKIRGFAFTIGTASDSNLRISGFHIGAPQVRIVKDPSTGSHTATRVGGLSAPTINGKPLTSATLANGDVIAIGKLTFTFRQ